MSDVADVLVAKAFAVAEPPAAPLLPTPFGVPEPGPPLLPPVPPTALDVELAAPARDVVAVALADPPAAPAPPLPPAPAPVLPPPPPDPPPPPYAVAELAASPGVDVVAVAELPAEPLPPDAPAVAPGVPLVPVVPLIEIVLMTVNPIALMRQASATNQFDPSSWKTYFVQGLKRPNELFSFRYSKCTARRDKKQTSHR